MPVGTIERIVPQLRLFYMRERETGVLHGFRLSDVLGYRGEPLNQFGLKRGAHVQFELDNSERVHSVSIVRAKALKSATAAG